MYKINQNKNIIKNIKLKNKKLNYKNTQKLQN